MDGDHSGAENEAAVVALARGLALPLPTAIVPGVAAAFATLMDHAALLHGWHVPDGPA